MRYTQVHFDLDAENYLAKGCVLSRSLEGSEAQFYAQMMLQRDSGVSIFIAEDDAHMELFFNCFRFFAPDIPILRFPAWDCLPYDRVSPNNNVVSGRLDTLTALVTEEFKKLVIVTTVNAFSQRIPPQRVFLQSTFVLQNGSQIQIEDLIKFLNSSGYLRVETVHEPGEYAVRGGIIDLFSPGQKNPSRLDFFGDQLEAIRLFDPLNQRTIEKINRIVLKPVSEICLNKERMERFRANYKKMFGAKAVQDPIYEAISIQTKFSGMEHWLPLFYTEMSTLIDYLPDLSFIGMNTKIHDIFKKRAETISDYFVTRNEMLAQSSDLDYVYRPIPPEYLYLTDKEWDKALAQYQLIEFSPHSVPESADVQSLNTQQNLGLTQERQNNPGQLFKSIKGFIDDKQDRGQRVIIISYSHGSRERLINQFIDHGILGGKAVKSWDDVEQLPKRAIGFAVLPLEKGYSTEKITLLTEQDIWGDRLTRPAKRKKKTDDFINEASVLNEGDYVVHQDHGIGQYKSLVTMQINNADHDFIQLQYDGGDKLFIPVENIDVISRFGSGEVEQHLDKLGGANWQLRKAKVKERLKLLAEQLIKTAAQREVQKTENIQHIDGAFEEFCARFPYPETEDQLKTIQDVVQDLSKGKPMDRLVCGDVGFGKTEVALRAAFLVAMSGKQVALLVPTTLLCRQHFQNFVKRFNGLPIKIRQLSRFVSSKELAKTREEIKEGKIDIIIGTHALLSKSTQFAELGLLIIDEEQHFGVAQKEHLKKLKSKVHVLTLTATPIPRTLQLAMSGVREMSIISTPPVDRLSVRTFVLPFDPMIIREAILREKYRGGQVYYVCPRLKDLPDVRKKLEKLVPEVKIAEAHGQLLPKDLENIVSHFYEGAFDVLLSTNIVESGLDLPTANTLIVHRADMFGLAQLYQLRGRVGRSKVRAYAYFTISPNKTLPKRAEQRLNVMQTLDTLGAGFTLASHDMDIRGAGNLLGDEQSGQIKEVGIELYQKMLEEAIIESQELKEAEVEDQSWSPQINLGMSVLIPESYIADLGLRLSMYRRISNLENSKEVEVFAAELIDRFGSIPDEVENLFKVIKLKSACRKAGVEKIEAGPKGALINFRNNNFKCPDKLIQYIAKYPDKIRIKPDHSLVYKSQWKNDLERFSGVQSVIDDLARFCDQ